MPESKASKTLSPDTSPEADAAQLRIFREMTGAQRSMLAARFSDEIREIMLAGIRFRQPDLDEQQVIREYARLTIDPELFEQAYGSDGVDLR